MVGSYSFTRIVDGKMAPVQGDGTGRKRQAFQQVWVFENHKDSVNLICVVVRKIIGEDFHIT